MLFDLIHRIGVEYLGGLTGKEVLDAGCGTGIYSEFYVNQGATVSGVDVSKEAINEVNTLQIDGEYQQSSLSDLPFDDDSFELTHCFSVLYHIIDDTEWMNSISELVRVTEPGGILVLRIAWREDTARPADHVKHRSYNKYLSALAQSHGCRLEHIYPFADVPKFEPILKALGSWGQDSVQDRLGAWLCKTDQFEKNPLQRVMIFRKPE